MWFHFPFSFWCGCGWGRGDNYHRHRDLLPLCTGTIAPLFGLLHLHFLEKIRRVRLGLRIRVLWWVWCYGWLGGGFWVVGGVVLVVVWRGWWGERPLLLPLAHEALVLGHPLDHLLVKAHADVVVPEVALLALHPVHLRPFDRKKKNS